MSHERQESPESLRAERDNRIHQLIRDDALTWREALFDCDRRTAATPVYVYAHDSMRRALNRVSSACAAASPQRHSSPPR